MRSARLGSARVPFVPAMEFFVSVPCVRFSHNGQRAAEVVDKRRRGLHTQTNCIQCEFTFGLLLFFCILFSDSSVNRIEEKVFLPFRRRCARHAVSHTHTHTCTFADIYFYLRFCKRIVAAETKVGRCFSSLCSALLVRCIFIVLRLDCWRGEGAE